MVDLAQYGPWAVIAGGSEGVGRAFAAELADAGVNLVLIARKPEALAGAAADMEQRGVAVRTLSIDLTQGDAPARIATLTADLDVGLLIYNAGANTYGSDFVTGDLPMPHDLHFAFAHFANDMKGDRVAVNLSVLDIGRAGH